MQRGTRAINDHLAASLGRGDVVVGRIVALVEHDAELRQALCRAADRLREHETAEERRRVTEARARITADVLEADRRYRERKATRAAKGQRGAHV